jgi:hypothetical protein
MTRDEVLLRLCRVCTRVATDIYKSAEPSDCFCEQSAPKDPLLMAGFTAMWMGDFRFSEKVLDFVENAVVLAIAMRPAIDAADPPVTNTGTLPTRD